MELPTLFILLNSTVPKKRKYQLNNWVMIIIHHWEKIPQVDILAKVIRELLLCSNKGNITLLYSVKIVVSASILSHQDNLFQILQWDHSKGERRFTVQIVESNNNRQTCLKHRLLLVIGLLWLVICGNQALMDRNHMILLIGRSFLVMIMEQLDKWIINQDFRF